MSGSGALANWSNQMRESARGQRIQPGPGYRLKEYPGGTSIELIPRGGKGKSVSIGLYQVLLLIGDTLQVWKASYNSDGSLSVPSTGKPADTVVALPWLLRAKQKPYPSATIWPDFGPWLGNYTMIYAISVGQAITGIPGVDLMYINMEGRCWSDTMVVCTQGIPKNRQMHAGPGS